MREARPALQSTALCTLHRGIVPRGARARCGTTDDHGIGLAACGADQPGIAPRSSRRDL